MNSRILDVLAYMYVNHQKNQRSIASHTGYSVGFINKAIKALKDEQWIDEENQMTERGLQVIKKGRPKNAVILAAGTGMRMVPINLSTPKGLLEVNGQRLIERLIVQLHEVNVTDITIVVGFMKEQFEYLIDQYNVRLVVNPHYMEKNNLYSLSLVRDQIDHTYIIPCDLWCKENPFRSCELYSWYMVSNVIHAASPVRVNRKMELVATESDGHTMCGICYLENDAAKTVQSRLQKMSENHKYDASFWEDTLWEKGKNRMTVAARTVDSADIIEINTYEQLRDLDSHSNHLQSDAIDIIKDQFHVQSDQITDISVLKKGMTNRSFLFKVKGQKYIMRIPGEGTNQLIDREQEAMVYQAIKGYGLCDDPVYINAENGYKITAFLEHVRTCDSRDIEDVKQCMKKLKEFHSMKLKVDHVFDIYEQIEYYESLWNGKPSIYRDYPEVKQNIYSLKNYIDQTEHDWCLSHIDAVPDNFLFYETDGIEHLQLTDWEYAGMQDPHVDIAMFGIYSLYDKKQMDELIDVYFDHQCAPMTRTKIYAYIAACGLLWSNWCEYKRELGVEFGEYSLRQYRYAKEYYRYVRSRLQPEKGGKSE